MDHKDALKFAIEKHGNQKYGNRPYSYHLEQVIDMCKDMGLSEYHMIVAALHDVLEDTDTTYEEIFNNFGGSVADCVFALTKRNDETYDEYLNRLRWNTKEVKICDILCNLKESTIQGKDKLIEKYQNALFQLSRYH